MNGNIDLKHLRTALEHCELISTNPPDKQTYIYENRLTSAKAMLVRGKEFDTLTFSPSTDMFDFVISGIVVPARYAGTWCHGGYALAHKSVWKQIKRDINLAKPLVVTGYSLGAVLAELTCTKLKQITILKAFKVHLIAFGKPNVFIKGQEPNLDFLTIQLSIVNGSDGATRFPPFFYGPDTNQSMLYQGSDGNNYINPDKQFLRDDFEPKKLVKSHMFKRYKKRVIRLLDEGL